METQITNVVGVQVLCPKLIRYLMRYTTKNLC